ncbi:MAG: hypothetical protein JO147_08890 [Actinobacteria bacterium]|nr:hypothetical protein [Actinomycetota bacterium]
MNDWINLHALWEIAVVGLICGAGLPALFAVGLRLLNPRPVPATVGGQNDGAAEPSASVSAGAGGIAAASLCFAVVLAAVAWGIYLIVNGS